MMGQKKFNMKQYHNLSLDDLVSPNDLYRKIDEAIDFSFIHDLAKESYSHTGQPSLDPVVFFKFELVGFLEGIHEDRALERRIKDSLAIRWFLGYDLDEALPVHSTISRTRRDRISKTVYQAVFDHILGICIRHQLVKGHHQSIDSTLLKANASLDSLKALQPKVLAHYEKLTTSDTSEDSHQDSHHPHPPPSSSSQPVRRDSEAKIAKKPGFPRALYYKASISVDEGCGIVTHTQVDDGSKNDAELLKSIVSGTKQRLESLGQSFQSLGADQGFYSAENLKFLDLEDVIGYLPVRFQPNNTGGFDRSCFRYDFEKDQFVCPGEKILKFKQYHSQYPHQKKYQAREKDCRLCPQKPQCTSVKFRTIQRSIHEDLIQTAIQRCQSEEGNKAELLRQTQAEGAYAHIKEVLKFRKLYSLGLENARKKFLMACSVINLKKLIQVPTWLNERLCQLLSQFFALFTERTRLRPYLGFIQP